VKKYQVVSTRYQEKQHVIFSTIMKRNPGYFFSLLLMLYFVLGTSYSFSQPKPDIKKTKSTVTIDGKKFYLHTVESGQTLYAISKVYEVTVNAIVVENPDAIDGLKIGQVLRIPFGDKKDKGKNKNNFEDAYYFHKVEQGETFYSITQKFKIKEDELLKLNPGLDKNSLKTGQLIKLPGEGPVVTTGTVTALDTSKKVIPLPETNTGKNPLLDPNENDFNVALFLPFYLSYTPYIETEKIKKGLAEYPEKSRIAVEFYQGVTMALDSLKKAGLSVKLHVYDSGLDSTGIMDISKMPELKTMNLIVGPLYTNSFTAMSKFAKENNIPIVSPLSQNNKILLGNVNVSKTVPSVMSQVERTADFVAKKFYAQNVMMLPNTNPKELVYLNTLKQVVNKEMKDHNLPDSVQMMPTISSIGANLKSDKVNVIVILNTNPSYVTDILSKLNKMKDDRKNRDSIIVVGMQSWSGMESIDIEYLNNLHVHVPANNFIVYTDAKVKSFIQQYRASWNTEPSEYVFQGYDVIMYYLSTMKATGSKAMQTDLPNHKWSGLHTNFDLYQTSVESGYENKSVFMLRYDHYQLVKAE
jgi:LysM repeat protein/ABC-type branched-subunit amino acid transport system substrate-binding protein